ncbi:17528_t:CDS:1, partial [Cetraspora pellucida]
AKILQTFAESYLLEESSEKPILVNWSSEFEDNFEPQQNENEAWNNLLDDW